MFLLGHSKQPPSPKNQLNSPRVQLGLAMPLELLSLHNAKTTNWQSGDVVMSWWQFIEKQKLYKVYVIRLPIANTFDTSLGWQIADQQRIDRTWRRLARNGQVYRVCSVYRMRRCVISYQAIVWFNDVSFQYLLGRALSVKSSIIV